MTTATAKLVAHPGLRLAPLALAALLLSAECRAEWRFSPSVTVRETWTDNASQQADDRARSQLITDLAPGFTLTENGRRLKLGMNAQYHVFGYTNDDPAARQNLANNSYQYDAHGQLEAIDELLWVDANASRQRTATSAFGPLADNLYSNNNRTDVSSWSISPYLRHRFGTFADATLRFTRDSVQGGAAGFGDSMASTRTLLLARPGDHTFGWNFMATHQDLTDNSQLANGSFLHAKSSSESEVAGIAYRMTRTLSLTADAGYDSFDYAPLTEGGSAQRTAGRRWSAGFMWQPSLRTDVRASFGHRYFGKTGMLNASHRTRNTVWSLDYNDDVSAMRSQFLLPVAFDTAALLNRLLVTQIPDAVQRQQAVQAYIAANGLPSSIAQPINYLSNRYIRGKRLQGAMLWRMPKSSLTLSVFRDERQALSLQTADSLLLGTRESALNDNVRDWGANLALTHKLSGRTDVTAGIESLHVRSLVTNATNYSRHMHAGLNHSFSRYTYGTIEVRQSHGGIGVNAPNFHENAIVALYSVKY